MGTSLECMSAPQTDAIVVELNADAVLFALDDDHTLRQLDAAHAELDRRLRAVPPIATAVDRNYVMVTDDGGVDHVPAVTALAAGMVPAAASGAAQLERAAIGELRSAVARLHRSEVRAYAGRLRAALLDHLTLLAPRTSLLVTVTICDEPDHIRFVPIAPSPRPLTAVDQAVADAIAATPTPASLPGTLLSRAEAANH